jgi:hypothetical protein
MEPMIDLDIGDRVLHNYFTSWMLVASASHLGVRWESKMRSPRTRLGIFSRMR